MSRSETNKEGPSVTLHMVSSLDGFTAKKDNSVSWINSTGSVNEAGVSVSVRRCCDLHQNHRLLCAWFSHV